MIMRGTNKFWLVGLALCLAGTTVFGSAGHAPAYADGEAEQEQEATSDDPVFLAMEPFLAPVVRERRIDRYVHLAITLELADYQTEEQALSKLTPLRNAFIQDLHFQAQMSGDDGRGVHLRRIKARFLVLAGRVLGNDGVRDVLFTEVVDRGF
jgi:flagellar basal body-associated protein FliL